MENSALNKAHQQHRRADNHLRYRRYSDAIECHRNAVDLLSDALKCTDNPRSLESISLQIDYHSRQKNIVNIKKEQHEHYKRVLAQKLSSDSTCETDDGKMLTKLIYHAIEETDSLIDIISKHRELNSDTDSTKSGLMESESNDEVDGDPAPIKGTKYPKDDKMVIEEFKIINKQLHQLVSQLVNQLENTRKENEMLKARLRRFENEKVVQNDKQSNNLKITNDSSGGTSPYVFSPCSEFSPDIQETKLLPPLEMPKFEFPTQPATNSKNLK